MKLRAILLFYFLLVAVAPSFGQEAAKAIIEEIQVVPDTGTGEWTIGGQKYTASRETRILSQSLPKPGMLGVIVFVESDGERKLAELQPFPVLAKDIDDGPYVFWKDKTTAEMITVSEGIVSRKEIKDITEPRQIEDASKFESVTLDPTPPKPAKCRWDAPSKLLAISDLEGNYHNALQFLKNSQVVDDQGKWIWGDGHLVLIGDLVDRGDMVTELMWLIRRLEREAQEAGGQVHYILGNHEAMVMAGDLRYIHPKYHFVTQRIGRTYDQLFNQQSDIGRWWRSKNAVMIIGDLLFVHGGYSPMLDEAKLDPEALNKRIRQGLAPAEPTGDTPAENPVLHQHGPFWYRGYFPQYAAEWGGLASRGEIAQILARHGAKHVVIGHTLVEQVGPLDPAGQVIAIDIKWKDPAASAGLLMEGGKLWRLNVDGEKEELFPDR